MEYVKAKIDGHEMEVPDHLMQAEPVKIYTVEPPNTPWFTDGSDVCAMIGEFKTVIADCLNHASAMRMDSTLNAQRIARAVNDHSEFLDGLEIAFLALGRLGSNMENGQERDAWVVLRHLLMNTGRLK